MKCIQVTVPKTLLCALTEFRVPSTRLGEDRSYYGDMVRISAHICLCFKCENIYTRYR